MDKYQSFYWELRRNSLFFLAKEKHDLSHDFVKNLTRKIEKEIFEKYGIKPKAKYHSKNRKDNRKNKIKVHFLNFIIDFTNAIIKGQMFGAHNILFRKLPHSEKKRYSH